MEKHLALKGQNVPRFFYGTAWKENSTAELTARALNSGFTAIDTANQRKHYYEEGAGIGIDKILKASGRPRSGLFLQTKYTYARGQDQRKPYNEADSFTKQVQDSFASSLVHLQTDYIDSYVLHGPYGNSGIGAEDLEVWSAMEKLADSGKVKHLGVSNVNRAQLEELFAKARIKPAFVQNRCYARMGWDKEVREVCNAQGMIYQGFSLLTANQAELASPLATELAAKYNKTVPQITFRFAQQLGMITLTGTSNEDHMKQDINIYDFDLKASEVSAFETISW